MKVVFTKEEILAMIHDGLCNGLGELRSCDVDLLIEKGLYASTKTEMVSNTEWVDKTICYEDVLLEILKNSKLTFFDHNEDEEISFTLEQAIERINGITDVFYVKRMIELFEEEGDAYHAVELLQICLYNEVIFG